MKEISPHQRAALEDMEIEPLFYTVAGFTRPDQVGGYHASQTIGALERRGLCRVVGQGRRRVARITPEGRKAAP